MALDVYRVYIPSDVPPGHFAGKLVKAIHTDTKNNIFPCDSIYGRDWSEAISYLGRKHRNSAKDCEEKMESPRVFLPLEHPLESRNNPQPSKPFMNWRVPSRYSDGGRPTSKEVRLMKKIQNDPKRGGSSSRQHEITNTTHHVPPQGKFAPIKSEQQEHMAEVLKREDAIKKHRENHVPILPRLSLSADPIREKPLEPKTYSAAQRWLKKNPGKERLAAQVLRQCGRSEIDNILENTLEPDAQKAVREWLKNATEEDRRAAIRFFTSLAGSKFLGGPSGTHPTSNVQGDKDARLRAVLRTLQNNKAHAPPQEVIRHQTVEDNIKALVKAARKKNLRLLTPETRLKHMEYQTWHHMPVYRYRGSIDNTRSMYTKPNAPLPRDFKIHPEWES